MANDVEGGSETIRTTCAVVGGGPAGMMCGVLLARAGVDVVVLEKHKDFLRDFRGDTIHPSTLDVIGELGWLDEFLKLPHQEARHLTGVIGGERDADRRLHPSADPLPFHRADAAMGLSRFPGPARARSTRRSICAWRPRRPA